MNDRLCWEVFDKYNYILHYVRYRKHQVYEKLFGLDYWAMPRFVAGKKLMSTPKTNQIIYDAIVAGKPFWAGRFGGTEMNMI